MSKRRVALIGASGQLGSDIVKVFSKDTAFKLFPLTHRDIEVTNVKNATKVFDTIKPEIIINTAAYHKVDEVEKSPKKAFLVNSIVPKNLAQYANNNKQTLVFLSSDYVFGAEEKRRKPYEESDCPGPINVYGLSKLAGEYCIRYSCPNHLIIRTSGLFGVAGASGKGGNFIETMLKKAQEKGPVRVVNDQIVTPTYTRDLAMQVAALLKTRKLGTYHATAEGKCSWYTFAKEIFKLTNTKVKLIPVTSSEMKTTAKRPMYSVLENHNLKRLGLNIMRHWKSGLKDYLKEKRHL